MMAPQGARLLVVSRFVLNCSSLSYPHFYHTAKGKERRRALEPKDKCNAGSKIANIFHLSLKHSMDFLPFSIELLH
jgi:hypothetical protein